MDATRYFLHFMLTVVSAGKRPGLSKLTLTARKSNASRQQHRGRRKNESSARSGVSKIKYRRFAGFNRKAPSIRRNP
jgi:hypothetical protein